MIFVSVWNTVMDLIWYVLCIGAVGVMSYVMIIAPWKGWQFLGNQFDYVADKLYHIDNKFYEDDDDKQK
ncbi:hypothetical protein ACRHK7_01270 [Weissella tructae]|uniref:hypothetical protein n=1 Tax=Weissella tructae TaxID=887702 RepID=UPI003D8ACB7E